VNQELLIKESNDEKYALGFTFQTIFILLKGQLCLNNLMFYFFFL